MSVVCPNGHPSETPDYCDQCGARIAGPGAPPGPAPAAAPGALGTASGATGASAGPPGAPTAAMAPNPSAAAPPGPAAPPAPDSSATSPRDELCPACQTPRIGEDRYCEGCGFDYTSPAPAGGPPASVLAAAPGTTSSPAWEAVAVADHHYYDRVAPEGVPFPLHCPPRTFLLAGDQIRIGRSSNSRGIRPEIDLSGAPEDVAISHLHCILIEQPDGSYAVVDPGSTNGTTLNDDATPLRANVAVAVADGDQIHVGAWTTITITARRAATP